MKFPKRRNGNGGPVECSPPLACRASGLLRDFGSAKPFWALDWRRPIGFDVRDWQRRQSYCSV